MIEITIWQRDDEWGTYQTVPLRKPTPEEHKRNIELLNKLKAGIENAKSSNLNRTTN